MTFRQFFRTLFVNLAKTFYGYNLLGHLCAILVTYIIVTSGADWQYYLVSRSSVLRLLLFPSVMLGFFLPIIIPCVMFLIGKIQKSSTLVLTSYALVQAASIGLLVSDFYKALTGRLPPRLVTSTLQDMSHGFQFGFLKGGVFWGWPSSHTTVAFAMSVALALLYPKNKLIPIISLLYAFYVGIGISVTIHWFSEFIAGAIFGSVVGVTVAKSFLSNTEAFKSN